VINMMIKYRNESAILLEDVYTVNSANKDVMETSSSSDDDMEKSSSLNNPGQFLPVVNGRAPINYDEKRYPFTLNAYSSRIR
jgi:hypothetical protein